MAVAEQADERALRVEGVATGAKAAELHPRGGVGGAHRLGQPLLRLRRLHADREAEAHVEGRASRSHRRPVAGVQGAHVQEVRLLELRDLGLGLGVELRLEPVQRLDDGVGGLDRVRAAVGIRGVAGVGLRE